MSTLTENVVLSRTRSQDLRSVKKLNCWGSELRDVSIVRRLPNVEVLSLSINYITTLIDFSSCKMLQELYLRKNKINDINELLYLTDLPDLKKLWLAENPCADFDNYRMTVLKALPNLDYLDNIRVTPEEVIRAEREGYDLVYPGNDNDDLSEEIHINQSQQQQQVQQQHECSSVAAVPPLPPQQQHHQPYQQQQQQQQQLQQESPPMQSQMVMNNNSYHSSPTYNNANSPLHETAPQMQARTPMIKSNSISDYIYNGSAMTHVSTPQSVSFDQSQQTLFQYGCDSVMGSASGYNSSYQNSTPIIAPTRVHSSTNGNVAQSQKLLPKGGKNRNANILSAVLCLIKELDYASLEVVDTTIHCRMEEMED